MLEQGAGKSPCSGLQAGYSAAGPFAVLSMVGQPAQRLAPDGDPHAAQAVAQAKAAWNCPSPAAASGGLSWPFSLASVSLACGPGDIAHGRSLGHRCVTSSQLLIALIGAGNALGRPLLAVAWKIGRWRCAVDAASPCWPCCTCCGGRPMAGLRWPCLPRRAERAWRLSPCFSPWPPTGLHPGWEPFSVRCTSAWAWLRFLGPAHPMMTNRWLLPGHTVQRCSVLLAVVKLGLVARAHRFVLSSFRLCNDHALFLQRHIVCRRCPAAHGLGAQCSAELGTRTAA